MKLSGQPVNLLCPRRTYEVFPVAFQELGRCKYTQTTRVLSERSPAWLESRFVLGAEPCSLAPLARLCKPFSRSQPTSPSSECTRRCSTSRELFRGPSLGPPRAVRYFSFWAWLRDSAGGMALCILLQVHLAAKTAAGDLLKVRFQLSLNLPESDSEEHGKLKE